MPEGDLLAAILDLLEDGSGQPLIVSTGGLIVSGHTLTSAEFHAALDQVIRDVSVKLGTPLPNDAVTLFGRFGEAATRDAASRDVALESGSAEGVRARESLYLRDATILGANRELKVALWCVRLSQVSGWMLGRPDNPPSKGDR